MKMDNKCKKEVRQIVKELRERAEEEKVENNRFLTALGGGAMQLGKQNVYQEVAEMLEERILTEGPEK